MIRIIGGKARRRQLNTFSDINIRPSADRLRETLFAILDHRFGAPYIDAMGIDFCAGTGSLGFEALSRGAGYCVFIDKSARACKLVHANARLLAITNDCYDVLCHDVDTVVSANHKLLASKEFTYAFIDPPYDRNIVAACLSAAAKLLAPNAVVVVEARLQAEVNVGFGYRLDLVRPIGKSKLLFLTYVG